ncbi:Protein NHR-36 [Aphelenchoides avenae]|nr:Protein NHR-36 [Aphelenchus avenae]
MDLSMELGTEFEGIVDFICRNAKDSDFNFDDSLTTQSKRISFDSEENSMSGGSSPTTTAIDQQSPSTGAIITLQATSSDSAQKRRRRQRGLPKPVREALAPKNCLICGASTNCCHYEVPSCHSCKAFFRRTVVKRVRYSCKGDEKCDILKGSRCKSCRLDRCLLAGMNIEAIKLPATEDFTDVAADLEDRRKRLMQQIQLKKPVKVSSWSLSFIMAGIQAALATSEGFEAKTIDYLIHLESMTRKLRESTFDPKNLYYEDIRGILKAPCHLSDADKYQKPSSWPMSMMEIEAAFPRLAGRGSCRGALYTINRERPFSHIEGNGRCEPPSKECQSRKLFCNPHWPTLDLILSIELAKTLPVYRKLELSDQEALLRHVGLVNAALTEAFYTTEMKASTMTFPNGMQPLVIRQNKRRGPRGSAIPEHLDYECMCRILDPLTRVGLTTEEYVMLKALIYCLDIPDLSPNARHLLGEQSREYAKILLRHMQSNLGEAAGAKKYVEVISLVDAFMHFAQKIREMYCLLFATGPRREPSVILGWAARVC